MTPLSLDVVWLKRDVRWHDHGPLAAAAAAAESCSRRILILYLYEPDQLAEPTVHGSHLHFIQEGLVDFDKRIASGKNGKAGQATSSSTFQCITVCHANALETLEEILKQYPILRLLAHEETGHWQSFMRDKAVRKWCRAHNIPFLEFNQTGVTRPLRNRDHFSKHFHEFASKATHPTPDIDSLVPRILQLSSLPGFVQSYTLSLRQFQEIPLKHRVDRPQRSQTGGETKALATLQSFLQSRGADFGKGISSPNTSWTSCSRLSPYLSWGHVSLRHVIHALRQRQASLRQLQAQGRNTGAWLKSLQAFSSRLHWRSHFLQKLESEPQLEKQDLCPAYQGLRRQEGDWNETYYQAWEKGQTGFPFVDACMRCLLVHGWINFRMRAMLVSFATYNLWLDWKRVAPHLARVFLDYEPGIHYPQLQMQARTTGINAMRVYNVTKQGQDQDPRGIFIRKYVPELVKVPTRYIHEPWKMPASTQRECQVRIIGDTLPKDAFSSDKDEKVDVSVYPAPIVDEAQSAKLAKAKVAAIRNQDVTQALAQQVYQKHGSRNPRRDQPHGRNRSKKPIVIDPTQLKLPAMFRGKAPASLPVDGAETTNTVHAGSAMFPGKASASLPADNVIIANTVYAGSRATEGGAICQQSYNRKMPSKNSTISREGKQGPDCAPTITKDKQRRDKDRRQEFFQPRAKRQNTGSLQEQQHWICSACTFQNDKPLGLICSLCQTSRHATLMG